MVPCDHTDPVCECIATQSNDNTCEFTLEIEHLQTFTKYEVAENGKVRGSAGRVWYINEAGTFKQVDKPAAGTVCGADDERCTEPCAVDGNTFRSFIAVNGRIPGPTLIVDKYKYVVVHVLNRLASESTTIHWHGMHQRDNNWMDGVEHITQCGIAPGTNFTYVFQATQSGTHWYHSHSGAQRTEGLFGALIVKEKHSQWNQLAKIAQTAAGVSDFKDLPESHTLSLLDWQKENSIDLFTQIHSSIRYFDENEPPNDETIVFPRTHSVDGAEVGPVSYWSGLINGRGRHAETVPYIRSRLSVFTVETDKVYRFRLIGAQSLFAYRVSVDEHKMILIAMDGALVQPVTFDYIIIHSGERYDFLLKTLNEFELNGKQRNNFIIRVETLEVEIQNTAEAILHYDTTTPPMSTEYEVIAKNSIPVSTKCTENSKCRAFNCPFEDYPPSYNINCTHVHEIYSMFPLMDESELPDVQVLDNYNDKVFLNFGFEGARQTSAINARNMKLPSKPLSLLTSSQRQEINDKEFCTKLDDASICNSNAEAATLPECTCTHVKDINTDRSIQMVFSAVGPDPTTTDNFLFAHPVHLHGHYFHVVDIQFGQYDASGKLTEGNRNINCGDDKTELCNVPSWVNEEADYSYQKSGKINRYSPLKDTVLIPAGGYAVVYFKANNPGYWFLHCHIEVHQLEGMGVVISQAVDKATRPPDDLIRECGNFLLSVNDFKDARSSILPTFTPTSTPSSGGLYWILIVIAVVSIWTLFFGLFCGRYCKKDKNGHHLLHDEDFNNGTELHSSL